MAKHPKNKLRLAKLDVDVHERMPASLKVTAIPAVFAFYKVLPVFSLFDPR